ncbi:MAG: serine/threonine-protein kinase [Pseudomonadota bacterium]
MLSKGDILNDTYEVERFLAEGGTGEVYLANNIAARRKVAIKVLKPAFSRDEKFLNLMRRELLQDVNHNAVVRYYDLLRTSAKGGMHFLVMEYIEGPSLAALMQRGPVDPDTLIAIGRRTAQGLRAAHAAKIYHRDVSPDNILLRNGDPHRATLIDFGIAKDIRPDARTVVEGFAGKYEYAAPEQLDARTDARSDIYSLGATLHAAARGQAPQMPVSITELYAAKQRPLDTVGISEPLASLIGRMSAPDPDERVQSAAELARAFDGTQVAADDDILNAGLDAPPPPARGGGRGSRPTSGSRGWVWLVLLLALLGGAGVAVWQGGLDLLLGPRLPVADPYRFSAEFGQPPTVTGDAPSEEARAALLAAVADVADTQPSAAIRLAEGVPGDAWATGVAGVIRAAEPLDQLRVSVIDEQITVRGAAASRASRDRVEAEMAAAAGQAALTLQTNIRVLIQHLPLETVAQVLAPYRLCGRLAPAGDSDPIPPEGELRIEGFATSRAEIRALEAELSALAEGRPLRMRVEIYNPFVCRVHHLLGPRATEEMRFTYALSDGGGRVNGNQFQQTDVPVIDLEVPAAEDGYLYAFIADNEGAIIHMLPYLGNEANRLAEIGNVVGGRRYVRIAHDGELDMSEGEPGVSFVFAVVAEAPLFDGLRVRVENVEELAPDLAAALARLEQRGQIRSIAMRPIIVQGR